MPAHCLRPLPLRRLLLALALSACGRVESPPESPSPAPPEAWFTEAAASLGLAFSHRSGARGEFHPPEIMGPGVALVNLDQDGDLDVYCVQGGTIGPGLERGAEDGDRLYLNQLAESGELGFLEGPRPPPGPYGQGVASGDYDGDGLPDLYVTGFGGSRLLHNRGAGHLEDVTAAAGASIPGWSVPAVFFDYDRDGQLDLFVGRYLDFHWGNRTVCRAVTGAVDYCAPSAYRGLGDRLLRNLGNGSFADATAAAGLDRAWGPALGAVAADLDGNGWLDLYVANDGTPNQLWMNRGDGTFRDQALLAGAAVNALGLAEAGMGVEAQDLDGDLDLDLLVTNLGGETNTFYRNDGHGRFDDRTAASGLGPESLPWTGFGVIAADFDGDRALDVFVANGAVRARADQVARGEAFPFHEPALLFAGRGDGRFHAAPGRLGAMPLDVVGRGTARGDVDNDGDVDLLVAVDDAPPRLVLNRVGNRRSWLALRLLAGGRDALGALVVVRPRGGRPLLRRAATDGSYASASDPRVLVGLGDAAAVEGCEVRWPDGTREEFDSPPLGRYTTLVARGGRR